MQVAFFLGEETSIGRNVPSSPGFQENKKQRVNMGFVWVKQTWISTVKGGGRKDVNYACYNLLGYFG